MPYKVDRQFRRVPWLTIAVIAVNVLVFGATIGNLKSVVQAFGFHMDANGLLYGWLTAMFLHAGISHIGGNMFFLWLFGSYVEDVLGWRAWVVTYLVGGFAAAVTYGIFTALFDMEHVRIPAIGASGALAAIMGLFVVRFYRTKIKFALCWPFFPIWKWRTFTWTSLVAIGLWFSREVGEAILFGGGDGVAHWAHIGGLLFGAAVGMLSGQREEADIECLTDEAVEAELVGNHALAAAKYDRMLEHTPTDAEALYGRARVEMQGGNALQAAEDLRQFAELVVREGRQERLVLALDELRGQLAAVPLDARTLGALASAAESRRRPDLASEQYWRVVQEFPTSREAERGLFRLAHIYVDAGMEHEARETWKRFLNAFPNSEWVAYAQPVLREGAA